MGRPVVLLRKKQLPNETGITPLTWYPSAFRSRYNKKSPFFDDIAILTCSKGHQTRMVGSTHSVDDQGIVTPSYVCTIDRCDFHAMIRLADWRGYNDRGGE